MVLSTAVKAVLVVAVILVVFGLAAAGIYNSLVGLDQNIRGKWSEVENQYQRQADLIPNLVSTVSSSVGVETKFVKDVVTARTAWQSASNVFDKDKAGVDMANGITAFVNAVAENYPVLQANKQYIALTDELTGTQNRIAVARGNYIAAIQSYNTAVRSFPTNILAGMLGFAQKDYYTASISAMTTPVLGNGTLPT